MVQRSREFQRKRRERDSWPCPLFSFEGRRDDVRKHLISIIKEEDQRTAVGRSARLDLTLANIKHVQGEERILAYDQICKKKSSSSRRWVAACAAAHVDAAFDEAGIGTNSATIVSVVAVTFSKDSTNGVSTAGELPKQIREALEKVFQKASKHPTHWTWEYLHRTARKKVRLYKSTRD